MRATLVVSVHDVAAATLAASKRWLADLAAREVPATLLVVPGPWRHDCRARSGEFAAWLRGAAGDGHEVALHGWSHRAGHDGSASRRLCGAVVARGCAEFWALDEAEATRRLRWGRATLAGLGFDPVGFTPPGWLASPGTRAALTRLGFAYTTTHRGVEDLRTGRRIASFPLSHRPGGAGQRVAALAMPLLAARATASGRVVRLALHPDDLDHRGLRDATLRTIDRVLAAGATACTYAALVGAVPAEVAA